MVTVAALPSALQYALMKAEDKNGPFCGFGTEFMHASAV